MRSVQVKSVKGEQCRKQYWLLLGKTGERATGIEPALPAWKAGTLPLSYARKRKNSIAEWSPQYPGPCRNDAISRIDTLLLVSP